MSDPLRTRPRILLLIPELQMGGAARVVRDHARLLRQHFHVEEAVFDITEGVDFPGSGTVHSLDVGGGGGLLMKAANFIRRVRRVRALKRALDVDLCISHLEGADFVNLLSAGTERTMVVVHGSKAGDPGMVGLKGAARRTMIHRLYNRADRIVPVSRDIKRELVALGVDAGRITPVNNFFDVAGIEAQSHAAIPDGEQELFDGGPTLITAGRLALQKNQAPLLDILAELKERPGCKLLILGDGELRGALLTRAEALGLSVWTPWTGEPLATGRDVYFLGVRTNPFAYLRRADLFLFPSLWEGFPLALCEAMICGLPVLSADCPTGPREILHPSSPPPAHAIEDAEAAPYGMLMPMLDQPERQLARQRGWADAIQHLLNKPAEAADLGKRGRERMNAFDEAILGSQWVALVREVLEPAR